MMKFRTARARGGRDAVRGAREGKTGRTEVPPEGERYDPRHDIFDKQLLVETFAKYKVDAVVHFAAFSLVGESMTDPAKYYRNNVAGTLSLLDAMLEAGVKYLVFSSSAATYGDTGDGLITEESPQRPTSVESHLIPIILQAALGQRSHIGIFGEDYPTRDGTCIRDYIHITDLADAHIRALDYLENGGKSTYYNLGNGNGFSVKEVIETARKVTGIDIPAKVEGRRPGDPATLVASSDKIKRELGWKPRYDTLEEIVASAWKWHSTHPHGFEK